MQPYRITTRAVPRACKASCSPASSSRRMLTAPFFGPHQALYNPLAELNPLFRLLDDATAELVPSASRVARHQQRSFVPRFDVREVGTNYELQGELPGVEQKDVEIEFVDERTLVIKGKSVREETRGNIDQTAATSAVEGAAGAKDHTATTDATDDAASDRSANYQKASVAEDEQEYVDAGVEAGGAAAKGKAPEKTVPDPETSVPAEKKSNGPEFKYWVSERSAGEFERRFAFPARVDQEAVKASLRDGILSVVVPKIVGQSARRIEIQ